MKIKNTIQKFSYMNVYANYKILYYDRIDVSEGTDLNKTNASKECNIYHYWYVIDYSF